MHAPCRIVLVKVQAPRVPLLLVLQQQEAGLWWVQKCSETILGVGVLVVEVGQGFGLGDELSQPCRFGSNPPKPLRHLGQRIVLGDVAFRGSPCLFGSHNRSVRRVHVTLWAH